jgi:hypothetical protein
MDQIVAVTAEENVTIRNPWLQLRVESHLNRQIRVNDEHDQESVVSLVYTDAEQTL